MTKVNLEDIPTGFSPAAAAKEMAETPKQVSDEALKMADLADEIETGTGTDAAPGPLSASRLKNHPHAQQNADIIAMLIGFVVAFALITMVDKQGTLTDYNFSESEREIVSQGFETWFNTFEEDFVVPGILAAFTPLAGVIYVKYEQAADAAKQRQPAPPRPLSAAEGPPIYQPQPPVYAQEITRPQTAPVPASAPLSSQQPAPIAPAPLSNQTRALSEAEGPTTRKRAPRKPAGKKVTTAKTSKA